ncbi:MAG: ribose 5-phosphate isomerase B [Phycisphaerae bacterium]|jgi:ribose 5-phosphate isomerase B|nr:ribose 5-phosphate isomerase B [Phycisphaerae bacterium]
MRIAIGSDHRGFPTKERLKHYLVAQGHKVADMGSKTDSSCDYPDYAIPVCLQVANKKAARGILLCGSGIGMTMTANKIHGIRAALCHDELTAQMSRHHNNANVLCLPADLLGDELIKRMVDVWLAAAFDAGRHSRRVSKVMGAEKVNPAKFHDQTGEYVSKEKD